MKRSGLTMIELVMMMVIIGIATAIITPGIKSFTSNWDRENEARKIAAALHEAQQLARTNAGYIKYGVRFDTGTECYELGNYDPYGPGFTYSSGYRECFENGVQYFAVNEIHD